MAWLPMHACNLPWSGGKESYWGEDFRERDHCFPGSLMTPHCGKTCLQNGWRRKCFRCNDWCALKLKEEGCSSSDITVKRHKVQQHICFLRSNTAPWLHQVQVRADRKRTYSYIHTFCPVPVLQVCRAASSVKSFSRSVPAHYKMWSSLLNNH